MDTKSTADEAIVAIRRRVERERKEGWETSNLYIQDIIYLLAEIERLNSELIKIAEVRLLWTDDE